MTERSRTILVTDSGLGGLSVFSGLVRGLARDARFDSIRLIYFNAWPEQYKGYNHYPDMEARAGVFHNALTAMAGFEPDQILIACNTLSVIYPHTLFSRDPRIPVTGIIDHGVEMIQENLTATPGARAVIFGTPATVEARTHEKALIQKGIPAARLHSQGCLNLAGKIERDPFGQEVKDLIDIYTKQAADALNGFKGRVFAALCCTHFGYCQTAFKEGLERYLGKMVTIINPNQGMVQEVCGQALAGGSPRIDLSIHSRVTWEPSRIAAYQKLMDHKGLAQALGDYTLNRELFTLNG